MVESYDVSGVHAAPSHETADPKAQPSVLSNSFAHSALHVHGRLARSKPYRLFLTRLRLGLVVQLNVFLSGCVAKIAYSSPHIWRWMWMKL